MKLKILALISVYGLIFSGCMQSSENVENPVNAEIRFSLTHTRDSISLHGQDSVLLQSFSDYSYTGDSNTVRISKTRDTVTFTFSSYDDKFKSTKTMGDPAFYLVTTTTGDKILYGDITPFFSDALMESKQEKYSLNAKAVIPMGMTPGKYKLIIRSTVNCFCTDIHAEYFSSEFAIK